MKIKVKKLDIEFNSGFEATLVFPISMKGGVVKDASGQIFNMHEMKAVSRDAIIKETMASQ